MKVSEAMQEGSASLTMTQASAATLPQDVASAPLLFAISAAATDSVFFSAAAKTGREKAQPPPSQLAGSMYRTHHTCCASRTRSAVTTHSMPLIGPASNDR